MITKIHKIIPKTAMSILLFMLISINILANNQDSNSSKIIHMIGIDLRPAHVFSTHEFFEGANNAQQKINSTLSGHLKYGFKFTPETRLGKIYPHAKQGIGVGYNTFFNSSELGDPIMFTFSDITDLKHTHNLSFDYEWNLELHLAGKI